VKKIKLDTGLTVSFDNKQEPRDCKCGEEIYFGITENGKAIPINLDMRTCHFSSCTEAPKNKIDVIKKEDIVVSLEDKLIRSLEQVIKYIKRKREA